MVEFGTIHPRESRGEQTEVEMVFNRQLIAALGVERAHLVLDFLESAFDFPAGRVVFDHLFGSEFKIRLKNFNFFRNNIKTGNKTREQPPIRGDRSKNKPEKQENFNRKES